MASLYQQKAASKTQVAGAEAEAAVEDMNLEFQQDLFEGQIERQTPYLEAGNVALPELVKAIQNRGDASQLPTTQIKRDIVGEFLGEQAPDFVTEKAYGDIDATEAELNKDRLSNLVNVALGSTGSTAESGANLASNIGSSLINTANIESQSLADQAANRSNMVATGVSAISSLPALVAAYQGRQANSPITTTPVLSPTITTGVPIGSSSQYRGYV